MALALTVTVELFNHKAFSEGPAAFWAFLAKRPLAAAVDYLLVLLTLLPTLFARRRTFWQTLLSVVWLGVGAANGFILLNRMTPFTIADLTVLNTGLDTLPNYLSPGYILLLAAAVAGAVETAGRGGAFVHSGSCRGFGRHLGAGLSHSSVVGGIRQPGLCL